MRAGTSKEARLDSTMTSPRTEETLMVPPGPATPSEGACTCSRISLSDTLPRTSRSAAPPSRFCTWVMLELGPWLLQPPDISIRDGARKDPAARTAQAAVGRRGKRRRKGIRIGPPAGVVDPG